MAVLRPYEPGPLNVGGSFRLPDTVGRQTVAPPNRPIRTTPDYMGAAIERLGGAIASLGGDLGQLAATRQATADASWLSKARAQTAIDWLEKESELRTSYVPPPVNPGAGLSSPPVRAGADGFTIAATKEFEAYRDTVLKNAPSPAAKQAYVDWANGFGAQIAGRAFEFEEASLFAGRLDDLNQAFDNHVRLVYQNPDAYDVALARAMDDLSGAAAWMTPEQELKARRTIETSLKQARAKAVATFDPLRFQEEVGLATGPIRTTAAKIIGIESAGNARAANPRSSASGLGQFTDATWLATVRKHRPDLAGMSDAALIQLKVNAELAEEMTIRHTEDNAAGLSASNIDPTEGNLYLAHFAGLEGARRVLGADPATPVIDVLGADVVRANPFLQGMTVGDLKAWADRKMAGSEAASLGDWTENPYYQGLDPDFIFALAKDADTAILKQHNAAVAERKLVYDAKYNSLMTALLDGNAGLADIHEARREGWLADFTDIKKAVDLVESRDKDAINTARAVARFADPNTKLNPFVAEDRKDIDLAYQAMGGSVALTVGDETSVRRLQGFVERTDSIPDSAVDALNAGMVSRDRTEREASMKVMSGLYRQYPQAVIRAFDEAAIKRLQDYEALAPVVPPDELIERLDPNADPTRRKLLQDMREEGAKLAAEIDTAEILGAFNPFGPFNQPDQPLDTVGQAALRADFERLFAERYAITRDERVAKQQAFERLSAKWGSTEVGDTPRLMAYPPERYYPAVNGDYDWMADQLATEVQAQYPDAQDWGIVEAPETGGAVAAKSAPGYYVTVIDADGGHRTLAGSDGRPALFFFDPDAARDEAGAGFEAERRKFLELEKAPVPARPMDTDLQWRLLQGGP